MGDIVTWGSPTLNRNAILDFEAKAANSEKFRMAEESVRNLEYLKKNVPQKNAIIRVFFYIPGPHQETIDEYGRDIYYERMWGTYAEDIGKLYSMYVTLNYRCYADIEKALKSGACSFPTIEKILLNQEVSSPNNDGGERNLGFSFEFAHVFAWYYATKEEFEKVYNLKKTLWLDMDSDRKDWFVDDSTIRYCNAFSKEEEMDGQKELFELLEIGEGKLIDFDGRTDMAYPGGVYIEKEDECA